MLNYGEYFVKKYNYDNLCILKESKFGAVEVFLDILFLDCIYIYLKWV
jgi:hypothetical protein